MAYKKREEPAIVRKLKVRLDGLKKINQDHGEEIEYGTTSRPFNAAVIDAQIKSYADLISTNNEMLNAVDRIGNNLVEYEKKLTEMYTEVLKSVIGKFGVDSTEVELVGGTRKSERKRPAKKAKPV